MSIACLVCNRQLIRKYPLASNLKVLLEYGFIYLSISCNKAHQNVLIDHSKEGLLYFKEWLKLKQNIDKPEVMYTANYHAYKSHFKD